MGTRCAAKVLRSSGRAPGMYGVIVGPVSFPLLEPALRIPPILCPMRSPARIGLPSAQYPAVWAAHFGVPGPIGPVRGGLLRNVGVTEFSEVPLSGVLRTSPRRGSRRFILPDAKSGSQDL